MIKYFLVITKWLPEEKWTDMKPIYMDIVFSYKALQIIPLMF